MGDSNGGNNSVSANSHGDGGNCADMNDRDTSALNLFNHRCTATSTGASGRCEDNRVNIGILQLFGELICKALGALNSGTVTNGGVEVSVQLADLALFLILSENVNRQDAVSILVGVDRVVAAVSGLVSVGKLITSDIS